MVYFIEAVGADRIKIGFTDGTVESRLKALQTGCPHPLRVVAQIPGGQRDEGELHRAFAHLRENGEWFRFEGEIRVFLWIAGRFGVAVNDLAEGVERTERGIQKLADSLAATDSWIFPRSGERDESGKVRCAIEVLEEKIEAEGADLSHLWLELRLVQERIAVLEKHDADDFKAITRLLHEVHGRGRTESARSLCGDCRA